VAIVDRRADGLSFNSSDWAEKKMWRTLASRQPVGLVWMKVSLKLVQQHGHGDVRMFRQRVAQRQGAMGGQLDDEPLGQRLDAVFLIVLGRLAADGDDCTLDGRRIGLVAAGRLGIGLGLALVLGTDIAAVDRQ
jgi:hypothetical protein